MDVTLVLVDDHKVVRQGLRALLNAQPGVTVVGEADNGRAAVELCRRLSPDVAIMDAVMEGLNGDGATGRIRAHSPTTAVIALSMHSDHRYVSRMLQAGASAYLLKTCDVAELMRAIRIASKGGTFLSPDIAGVVVEGYLGGAPVDAASPDALSDREREILQLLTEGRTAKQIGALLHVSSRTIDSHRQRIQEKLDIHNLPGLTKYAVRTGLTPLEV